MASTHDPAVPFVFNYGLLRFLREQLGLSMPEVVRRLYALGFTISDDTYQNWELGEYSPDAKDLPYLAKVLGAEPDDFFYQPKNNKSGR